MIFKVSDTRKGVFIKKGDKQMTEFTQFLSENMYIVAAALYVLGIFAKAIPQISDWTIPICSVDHRDNLWGADHWYTSRNPSGDLVRRRCSSS